LTSQNLIGKARQGDIKAFEQLVTTYQDRVYSHCLYLTGNPDDAQDLAQDVFVQAYKAISSFRHESDFGTWLHRIAVNQWINFCRRQNKITTVSIDEPLFTGDSELVRELAASSENPLDKLERSEFNLMVKEALDRLQPEFRMALILRDIEGYNYDEIAALLDCSLGTVKSRINRGRRAMKTELESYVKA
jgi:RNA polymerase sigma-70 factor, ECF subfamily